MGLSRTGLSWATSGLPQVAGSIWHSRRSGLATSRLLWTTPTSDEPPGSMPACDLDWPPSCRVTGKLLHRTQSCGADASFLQLATTVGNFDLAPGPVHVEEDEQVGGPVALVFAVVAFKLARFGRDRRPDLADQLGRALIKTHDRMLGIEA